MTITTTRRAMFAAIAIAPAVIAAPAFAAPTGCPDFCAAMKATREAAHRFNNLPRNLETDDPAGFEREMETMLGASRHADRAIPTTWQEFARLLEHMTDNGLSNIDDDNAARLLSHTRRLLAGGL